MLIKLFTWFEENTDQAYRYAVRVVLSIWLILIFIIVILICYFLKTFQVLPLSAIAISLSAIMASLMAWYSIETVRRTALENERKTMRNDFIKFYAHSFTLSRTLDAAINYESLVLPEEIPQMVVFTIEQYIAEYHNFTYLHLIFNADENRIVSEQILGLSHSLAKLKRTIIEKHAQITREAITEAKDSMNWIINKASKRLFDDLNVDDHFNINSKR